MEGSAAASRRNVSAADVKIDSVGLITAFGQGAYTTPRFWRSRSLVAAHAECLASERMPARRRRTRLLSSGECRRIDATSAHVKRHDRSPFTGIKCSHASQR
jgi:hypothetical protein